MLISPVLPSRTAKLIEKTVLQSRHPGLQLDKFIGPCGNQEQQKAALTEVCKATGDNSLLQVLLRRRESVMMSLSARVFRYVTTGSLTLHLARASVAENAGICLHPIYGFAYLPGSGLKGMARAFAERIWLPHQADKADKDVAKSKINEIFGALQTSKGAEASAGLLVFHDAWPERWPQLYVDIVNNHHKDYYAGKGAPGDWEDPTPISFLAIGAGETFCFAISKRSADVPDEWVDLGSMWLAGALTYLGVGAKTNAGYGYFQPARDTVVPQVHVAPLEHKTTMELVSPAFLAGAYQQQEDAELRPATLRGLLRWWWRTMHSGYVDVPTLRRLEASVWGDTKASGAVRLIVEPVAGTVQIMDFDKRAIQRQSRLKAPPNNKTTQGLGYHSRGMDEKGRRRCYVAPGAKWSVRFMARPSSYPNDDTKDARHISSEVILKQAQAALWLLCHYGGVGSKSRKGFGSFADQPGLDLDGCKRIAAEFRAKCGVSGHFDERQAESPSLEQMLPLLEQPVNWKDPWFALDQVGYSAQDFAKRYKHRREKMALGLPREIGYPQSGTFHPATPVVNRHAAPVHYHLGKSSDGKLVVRVVAFPAGKLPNLAQSRAMLEKLLAYLAEDLVRRNRENNEPRTSPFNNPAPSFKGHNSVRTEANRQMHTAKIPKAGERVEAILMAEKTAKGGWKARHEFTGLCGPIQNTRDVPVDCQPGSRVILEVASVNAREMSFRWPKH